MGKAEENLATANWQLRTRDSGKQFLIISHSSAKHSEKNKKKTENMGKIKLKFEEHFQASRMTAMISTSMLLMTWSSVIMRHQLKASRVLERCTQIQPTHTHTHTLALRHLHTQTTL